MNNIEDIIKGLIENKIKFYEVEKLVNNDKGLATHIRAQAIEEMWGVKIPSIKSTCIKEYPSMPASPTIGSTQIPVSITGPVRINGDYAYGLFPILLATTEGGLTESIGRGCKIINLNGGVNTQIREDLVGIARAPCIKTIGIREAENTRKWIKNNYDEIKKVVESTSNHLSLKKIDTYVSTRYVYPRFIAYTNKACGMNMITIGARKGVDYIIDKIGDKYGLKLLAMSGNVCVDKKSSSMNLIEHIGFPVSAEVRINNQSIKHFLKTSIDAMLETYHGKNVIGSFTAGVIGNNSQVANVIAAINAVTGQDLAHVVEGSHAILDMQRENDDLYVALEIPALKIGIVGGGTPYPTMREARELMDCDENIRKLPEIISAAALAGEISLNAALSSGTLASSHKRLGRL